MKYRYLRTLSSLARPFLHLAYKKVLEREDSNGKRIKRLLQLYEIRQKYYPLGDTKFAIAKLDNNLKIRVNLCERVGGNIYYGVHFEPQETSIIRKLVTSGETFFDIGANIGLHSLRASTLVGKTGTVHAFEPLTHVYEQLLFNLELNQVENVITNNIAVLNESREVDLYVNQETALTSLGDTNRGKFTHTQKIQGISLDAYSENYPINIIDFLKIDIEGFEGHVLRGAKNVILDSPDIVILCELAEKNFKPLGFSINETIDWMRDQGFEVWEIDSENHFIIKLEKNKDTYLNQNFIFIHPNSKKYEIITRMSKNASRVS